MKLRPRITSLVCEGKTKKIFEVAESPRFVLIESKDDITAGDGARHDVIPDKAKLATRTTCNVFNLLRCTGVPVAYVGQVDAVSFLAVRCRMIPVEVVVRHAAYGSHLKRHPGAQKGDPLPQAAEFYLKTSGRLWAGVEIPKDDPWIKTDGEWIDLYEPDKPLAGATSFLRIPYAGVFGLYGVDLRPEMARIAELAFRVLRAAWASRGMNLVDFKVEFGVTTDGELLLADVIDNDSWRLLDHGAHLDKQVYREGGGLSEVARKYRNVAEISDTFLTFSIVTGY